jgi:hypothetical protein
MSQTCRATTNHGIASRSSARNGRTDSYPRRNGVYLDSWSLPDFALQRKMAAS